MPFDHIVALSSAIIALISAATSLYGILLVLKQMRESNKERESEALVKLYDINRQLISLGFSHPVLLEILEDKQGIDLLLEKRYLQMWLNQLSLIHASLQNSVSQVELRESLERNLVDFMTLKNMRRHWHEYGKFYPMSFQACVNGILKMLEPPKAAQVNSGR